MANRCLRRRAEIETGATRAHACDCLLMLYTHLYRAQANDEEEKKKKKGTTTSGTPAKDDLRAEIPIDADASASTHLINLLKRARAQSRLAPGTKVRPSAFEILSQTLIFLSKSVLINGPRDGENARSA